MTRYEIIQNGMKARGRGELLKHLEGKKLTQRQAILGKCFDCMGYYIDGKEDCGVTNCSLYPFMPYRNASKTPVICSGDTEKYPLQEQTAKRHRKVVKEGI